MNQNLTDVTILLDSSGSMRNIQDDTRGGFNDFLDRQAKVPGECNVTVIQFDRKYEPTCVATPIKDAPRLTEANYRADGVETRYLDALARAIKETGERLAAMPEADRPSKVIFVTITDGQENASIEYHRHRGGWTQVKAIRQHQEDVYKWSFVLIGQDFDTTETQTSLGMSAGNAVQSSKVETISTYQGLSKGMTRYRAGTSGARGANGLRGASGSNVQNFAELTKDSESEEQIIAQAWGTDPQLNIPAAPTPPTP